MIHKRGQSCRRLSRLDSIRRRMCFRCMAPTVLVERSCARSCVGDRLPAIMPVSPSESLTRFVQQGHAEVDIFLQNERGESDERDANYRTPRSLLCWRRSVNIIKKTCLMKGCRLADSLHIAHCLRSRRRLDRPLNRIVSLVLQRDPSDSAVVICINSLLRDVVHAECPGVIPDFGRFVLHDSVPLLS